LQLLINTKFMIIRQHFATMYIRLRFLPLFAFFSLLLSCVKDTTDGQLPIITTEGNETFAFRILGETWAPFTRSFAKPAPSPLTQSYTIESGKLRISAFNSIRNDHFLMEISGIYSTITYNFADTAVKGKITLTHEMPGGMAIYSSNPLRQGFINILRLDTQQRICAGTFETIIYSSDSIDVLRLTQGRFDFKF
jgi:hypothetical protein